VLPLLHSAIVDPGWVGNDQFVAGYGAAQAVPGPLFTFAGYLGTVSSVPPNGALGGVVAVVAIFLPGLLLLVAAMPFWHELRGWRAARSAFAGINAAVIGILAAALYTPVWTSAVAAPVDVIVAAAGFGLLMTGRVPPIVVVGLSALAGQALALTV
jgi:chromate transporter